MRLRTRIRIAVAATAVAAVLSPAVTATAHALPQTSSPAEGATVSQAPAQVRIVFGETPDPQISSITVVDSSGNNVDAGPTTAVPGQAVALQVPLKPHLPNGVYTVTWKTISTVDGHLATGAFAFGVGVSAKSGAVRATAIASTPTWTGIFPRTLLFVGVIAVLGTVILGLLALDLEVLVLRRIIAAGALCTDIGALGVIGAQTVAAGLGLGQLFHSSLGRSLLERIIPALILSAAAGLLLWWQRRPRVLGIIAGLSALAEMAVDVVNSHAASENPVSLNILAQWLHIAAVGLWIGGLITLVVVLTRIPADRRVAAARRFSTLAGVGLVLVAATGVFRAAIEVQSFSNLVGTTFGVLVLVKSGLLIVLMALGAVNRYRNIPDLPQRLGTLKRVASGEVVVGFAAITVAATLVNLAPPVAYGQHQPSTPASLVINATDYATTVRARLEVTPGTAGFNTFSFTLAEYDSGAPFSASAVVLHFNQPFRPALGSSTLTLAKQGAGSFRARGGNLSLSGIWEVAAIIESGERSTEVHFQLATAEKTPPVTVTAVGNGLPTIYTVQISSDLSAQVYLDPDKPGQDEFHVTFLQNNGQEDPMADTEIGMTPASATPRLLAVRRLDDIGHFVADANVPPGPTRFDVLATTASGKSVSTYLVITPGR